MEPIIVIGQIKMFSILVGMLQTLPFVEENKSEQNKITEEYIKEAE